MINPTKVTRNEAPILCAFFYRDQKLAFLSPEINPSRCKNQINGISSNLPKVLLHFKKL